MAYHINWGTAETLEPDTIDGHKSFYGKAYTRQGSALTPEREYVTVRELYSYGTKVAAIYMHRYSGPLIIIGRPCLFSATTSRHFRAFTRQNADGIAYGIKDIRKSWEGDDDTLGGGLIDARTWNGVYAADNGYRF